MNRPLVCALAFPVVATIAACSFNKQSPTNQATNQSAQSVQKPSPAAPEVKQPQLPGGELQPGQASGKYTAAGEEVELKYAYAGRAVRFGTESLIVLLTDKPIPPDAVAE